MDAPKVQDMPTGVRGRSEGAPKAARETLSVLLDSGSTVRPRIRFYIVPAQLGRWASCCLPLGIHAGALRGRAPAEGVA
jgi:hypothetical protein